MRTLLVSVAALGALSTAALAADLPRRAPAAAPAPIFAAYSWSGFYAGVQAGYLWSENRLEAPEAGRSGPYAVTLNPDAFNLGALVGFRHQYSNNIVVGIEADINFLIGDGDNANYVNIGVGPASATAGIKKHRWDGGVRAQLGYAAGRWLPYLTGGVAFLDEDGCAALLNSSACAANTFYDSIRTGWTVGAGVAYALTNNVIVNAEYRYADFGTKTYSMPTFIAGRQTSELKSQKVLLGLSWKFGGSSPVVARY